MKTLAIRLDEETHAQLAALAALQGTALVDEIREAITGHLERTGAEGTLAERGQAALEEIDREVATRRAAIQALMGQGGAAPDAGTARGRGQRKGEAAGGEA